MAEILGYNLTREDMAFTHGFTPDEVMQVGAAFLAAVGNCAMLGHNSPAGMVDYIERPGDGTPQAVVWDAFAATVPGNHEASDRLWKVAGQRGLLDAIAAAMA